MNDLITITNLAIGYDRRPIIEQINFHLKTQQICCVLGANGSGKSTFLKTLLGLIPPISGKLRLKQRPLSEWRPQELAKQMAYVPQAQHSLFPFSVLDMVLMGRSAHLAWYQTPTKQDRQIALEALASLDIAHLASRFYPELSGGEKQLVLIARALTQHAPLLIMDEPTASLDFGNQIRVLEKINALRQQNRALIITTHHPQQAEFLAHQPDDSVVIINQQQTPVFMQGTTSELFTLNHLADAYHIEPHRLAQHLHVKGSS